MASTSSALPSVASAISAPNTNAPPHPGPNDGFLKPASPRKRRRSLEGQVRDKLHVTPVSPIALTGANEMAEQQKRRKLDHQSDNPVISQLQSPNPRQQALGVLRGGSKNMSKPTDAPMSNASSTPATSASTTVASPAQVSPISNTSFNTSTSTNAGLPQVASPTQMGESDAAGEDDAQMDDHASQQTPADRPYTYPDPRLSAAQVNSGRNHSIAGSGADSTRSPASNKKHKCPYCETEFTRHHNLKSHLLTHSQEKPYLCQECDMRFRRLHDLKRHSKLHTGERPHVCNICNRKFARGDALARHTKGAGGCAGHRQSVGSFSNEAGEGEMVMDGLMYAGAESQEPGEMDENDGPGRQVRQQQHPGNLHAQPRQPVLPQTYPPAPGRSGPHLQAPAPTYSGNTSPAQQHAPYQHPSQQQGSYPPPFHGNMTESPGPISPSAGPNDPRRSSVNSSLQRYAQQGTSHAHGSPQVPTATMGLPMPGAPVPSNGPGAQFLPSLPSITTSDRGPAQHGHAHNASGSYASAPGSASTGQNSLSSHGQGSGDRTLHSIDDKDRLYALFDSLKRTIDSQNEKIETLERTHREEILTLKRKIDTLEKRADSVGSSTSTASAAAPS